MTIRKVTLGLLVSGICILTSNVLHADTIEVEIKNHTAITTANDLNLVFTKAVGDRVTVIDKDGKKTKKATDSTRYSVEFDKGELPSNIKPGESLKVRFDSSTYQSANLDLDHSYWTDDGARVINGLASINTPPDIIFNDDGVFAEFSNPESFAIVYTDILLFRNNDLTSFNLDDFTTPMGQFVTGLLSSFVLDPGQSMLLPFGSIAPDTYQLATAEVAAVSDPGDTYAVAAAAAVSEPSTFTLLGLGYLAVAAYGGRLMTRLR